MDGDPVPGPSGSSTTTAHGRRLLPRAGYDYLHSTDAYIKRRYPPAAERRAILEELHRIPGCQHYTAVNLQNLFQNRKSSVKRSDGSHTPTDRPVRSTGDVLYPSLSPRSIASLEILLKETPAPPPQIIKIWAMRLEADLRDVQTWIELRQLENPYPHIPQLPSPELSTSPEPIFTPRHIEAKPSYSQTPEEKKPLFAPKITENSSARLRALGELGRGLREALSQPPVPVRNAAEFAALFAPHDRSMTALVEKLNGSHLAPGSSSTSFPSQALK